ncbi:MAG: pantetheine-phosphate adenylyltransferase, partial [Frankiaceae bacterium]|nr:pantetheine-phosphate adenylyltransferase [Frankiaceae bacterium]
YDEVVVAVLINSTKVGLYDVSVRMELLRETTADLPNVTIDSFDGLLVDYCKRHDLPVVVKGLRAVSDFDYELQMAQMNHGLAGVETMFLSTNPLYSFLSSSLVKQVARYGGDISTLVPPVVAKSLAARFRDG